MKTVSILLLGALAVCGACKSGHDKAADSVREAVKGHGEPDNKGIVGSGHANCDIRRSLAAA